MPADLRKIGSFSIYFLYSFVMKLEKNMTIHVSLSTMKVKPIINNWLTPPGPGQEAAPPKRPASAP